MTWSRYVEIEADRHSSAAKILVVELRARTGWGLSKSGTDPQRFSSTGPKDRQVVADAVAAGAAYLVTEDVDDFSVGDLVTGGISAVNPDLFMSLRFTRAAYSIALNTLTANRTRPPDTAATMHAAIARQHPMLYAAFADLYPVNPLTSTHKRPAELFRGPRCVRCGHIAADPAELTRGLHEHCLGRHS